MSKNAKTGIDLDLSGLLGQLGGALTDLIGRLDPGEGAEQSQSRMFTTDKGPVHTEVRVRMGGLETARAAPFRSRPAAPAAPPQTPPPEAGPRPAHVTVWQEGDQWTLSAELPGVTLAEVTLSFDGDDLVLSTTGARRFAARHPVPAACDRTDMSATVRNGIIVISLPLREAP